MNRLYRSVCILLALVFVYSQSLASSFFDQFTDPKDGKFDTSQWLAGRSGFLPVPLLISDPAVGYGVGLALAFFHESKDEEAPNDDINAMLSLPPSVSFVAGAYTENESGLVAAGHMASWKQDTIRYLGVLGYGDLNLKFYGISDETNLTDDGLKFNIQGLFFLQELIFRVKESDFFVGGRYSYLGSEIGLSTSNNVPEAPEDQLDSSTAGLGLLARYDSRDNIMSPNAGHYAKLDLMFYDEAFGGDYKYTKTKLSGNSYWPISNVVLGLRLEGDFSDGDVPFYDVPYIDMRGIPALRYQGLNVVLGEIQARWDLDFRWSLTGFGGGGWTADNIDELSGSSFYGAGGVGFRYLMARRYGLRAGLDVARGPEDTVVYLAVGSNWR